MLCLIKVNSNTIIVIASRLTPCYNSQLNRLMKLIIPSMGKKLTKLLRRIIILERIKTLRYDS